MAGADDLLGLYRDLWTVRAADELAADVPVGGEAVVAGVRAALREPDELWATRPTPGVAALCGMPDRGYGRGSGGALLLAAGAALAHRHAGAGATAVLVDEGGVRSGAFHEALGLAARWTLPLVLVCCVRADDGGWRPGFGPSGLAPGHGVRAEVVDGAAVAVVRHVAAEALGRARDGDGATVVEALVGTRDPVVVLGQELAALRLLDAAGAEAVAGEARRLAGERHANETKA